MGETQRLVRGDLGVSGGTFEEGQAFREGDMSKFWLYWGHLLPLPIRGPLQLVPVLFLNLKIRLPL